MASTMQEALQHAGLVDRGPTLERVISQQTLTVDPKRRVPRDISRHGRRNGTIEDLIGPLDKGLKVWILHPSSGQATEALSIVPDGRFATVKLEDGTERKFRLAANVRFIQELPPKKKGRK